MIIGHITVPRPLVVEQHYEVAAWRSKIELQPGIYPITLTRDGWVCWGAPGTYVDVYTPSLFGGVPFGNSPQGTEHQDVGRSTQWSAQYYDYNSALQILREGGFYVDGVLCPVTLMGVSVSVYRRWAVFAEPRLEVRDGKYVWTKGLRGRYFEYGRFIPRFLPRNTEHV